MEKFVIDTIIKEQFDFYRNMCSFLSEFFDSTFDVPATLEKIEQWEKDNKTELPHQYKSWLLLSAESRILDGYIEFSWPTIGTLDEENDIVIIGVVMGDGEEVGIKRATGTVYSIYDGEEKEYSDFDDFLTYSTMYLEDLAEENMGNDWGDIFEEKYGK